MQPSRLGVRRGALSDFLNKTASLSPEMALRIEMAFSVLKNTLVRVQARFDSHVIRQRAGDIKVGR